MQDKNYAILGTMLQKQSYFVKKRLIPFHYYTYQPRLKDWLPSPLNKT